jgi:hypothetical protein
VTGAVTAARLERRYRRLLTCYPTEYLAVYGEEMIGVLMTASTPDQRRPDVRESFGLISGGLAARLRMTMRAGGSPAWRDAARAYGYLASATIAVFYVYRTLVFAADPFSGWTIPRTNAALAVVWTFVAVAAGLALRRLAAVAAIVGAAGTAVAVTRTYTDEPGALVTSWWVLVLAVTGAAALAAVIRPGGAREGERWRPLGVRSRIAVGLAAILMGAAPALESLTVVVTPLGDGLSTESYRPPVNNLTLWLVGHRPVASIAIVAFVVTLAVVVLRLSPAVRRRVVVLALPAAVTELIVVLTFNGFLQSSPQFYPPVYLVAPQWITLFATPVLVFAAGAWLVARYERQLASGVLLA